MPAPAAVLDANVLYSALLRDLLLELAVADMFSPKWTDEINREWADALARARADIPPTRLHRLTFRMNSIFPLANVPNASAVAKSLHLPDPRDRHVLAAAIVAQAPYIVTFNLADFPARALAPLGVAAIHPDRFLCHLHDREPARCLLAAHAVRRRLKNPAMNAGAFADALRRHRAERFAVRFANGPAGL